MESSSTSSSDSAPQRRRPRAFLLAASVVLAAEVALAVATPRSRGRHVADDMLLELEPPQPHRRAVLWGDSVTRNTIDHDVTGPWMRDISTTQAIGMAGVLYTYERLVETAGPPELFALVTIPETWGNDLDQVFTPTYFESCFLRPSEMTDFARTTGRYAQTGRMLMQAYVRPPSSQRQGGIRVALNRLRGLETRRGWMRGLEFADETAEGLAERAQRDEFVFSDISRLYLEKLAQRTKQDGTWLVLMTAALPRSVADSWMENGYLYAYEGALRSAAARHDHVAVEPPLYHADYEDEQFYDPTHLMPGIRDGYGERVVRRVRELLDE